jgi:predicted nucleotidyltransferase
MRPPSKPSSFFHHPLDQVLGTVAAVRLLRELSEHGGAISVTDLASRVGLSLSGAIRALERLQDLRVVEPVGTGRGSPFRLITENPLCLGLIALFDMEHRQTQSLYEAVQSFASQHEDEVLAVWLYGSVARSEEKAGSDVDILVVAWEASVSTVSDELSDLLLPLSEWSMPISVVGVSPKDIEQMAVSEPEHWERIRKDAVVLAGKAPQEVWHGKK